MAAPLVPFPRPDPIPADVRVEADKVSMRYLIGGEVKIWRGKGRDVESPVCLHLEDNTLRPAVVGRAPMLDKAEALAALDAAVAAWNHGRGVWPHCRRILRP